MKTLVLLRHAKAENGSAVLSDFDRALNDRGRKEAQVVGRVIRKHGLGLDLVLSSTAKRARETTELLLESADLNVEVRYEQRFYESDARGLLEIASQIEDERGTVLLVGHNPGMEELLQSLTGCGEHMTTGTIAKIDLNAASWSQVFEEKGRLDWIEKPNALVQY